MKRVIHYFLLVFILIGVPLGCAWFGGKTEILADVAAFPPKGDVWLQMPERLWAVKCPFSWGMFALFAAITIASIAPFLWRMWRGMRGCGPRSSFCKSGRDAASPFPWWGWVAFGVMMVGWVLAWTRFPWFAPLQRYPYILQWGGFIFLMNARCVKRCGHSPFTDHPLQYFLLFPVSSLFWWFFEYLNRYVWNWFYVGVVDISAVEYAVLATLCFSSVLPGVVAVAAWLNTFRLFQNDVYADMTRVNVRSKASLVLLAFLSLVGLTGIVFVPQFAYPLLWISPLMVFVLVQVILKESCVLDVLMTGNWGVIFRFATAALICGFVWETWNYYSYAKWVYNVPWVYRFHIWEMPIVGFAGYLPFGVECAAIAAWVCPNFTKK